MIIVWGIAIFAFLIAFALCAVGGTLSFNFSEDLSYVTKNIEYEMEEVETAPVEDLVYEDEAVLEEDLDEPRRDAIYVDDSDHGDYIRDMIFGYSLGLTLLVTMLVAAVVLTVLFCSLYTIFYTIFVGAPLQTGYMRFNLDLFKTRKEVSLNRMLHGFKNCYSRSAGSSFLTGLVHVGVGLRWLLVPIALLFVGGFWPDSDMVMLLCVIALFISLIAWGIASIKVQLTYSMCYYILADHPDMSARDVLKASKEMMVSLI